MTHYKFSDRLMFAIVMQDADLCKQFIERLFPGKKVADIKFRSDIKATAEATIIPGLFAKSVRLDVLFEDSDIYYDIEMQVEGEPFIAKRSRYYHSSMDTHTLKKGEPYSKLKPCYVIFICLHDPFGLKEPVYSFEMRDEKLGLQLGDESFTIILDVKASQEKIPKELETFFAYVSNESVAEDDEFIKGIHQRVEEANHDAEVIEIMTLAEDARFREIMAYDKGVAEGEQAGYEKGEQAGAKQEKKTIALQMLKEGMKVELISRLTGLTADEIEKLQ